MDHFSFLRMNHTPSSCSTLRLIPIPLLILVSSIGAFTQIPRKVLDLPKSITNSGDVNTVLPGAPSAGSNEQNITVAPVLNPGNNSVTTPAGTTPASLIANSVEAGGAVDGKQGTQTEGVLAEKLKTLEVDPTNDQIIDTKRGSIWNITDNRVADARFERYLNLDAAERKLQEEYLGSLNALLQLLCPRNPYGPTKSGTAPGRNSLSRAYDDLRRLGQHEYDHRISTVIANQVDSVNAALTHRQELYTEAQQLEKEIDRLHWNLGVTLHTAEHGDDKGKLKPRRDSNEALSKSNAAAGHLRKIARAKASQAGKIAQADAKLLIVKTDFQALLGQLFAQRRFQHVLIASAFYRASFGDGELKIESDGKIQAAFDLGSVTLTVSTLEGLTTEAIREVRQGVEAVRNMIGRNQLQSAEKRLMETYFIGEHLPEMQSFPSDSRTTVLSFRETRRAVAKAIEVKDYSRAKERNDALAAMASDYDVAPARAAISASESKSNFHLAKARNAAIAGDKATMEAEVQAAAALWPQNPALNEGAKEMMERFDLQVQSLKELDALLDSGDLRGIEAKREVFSAAVATDKGRQKKLRNALEQLLEIEKALERAREFDARGSSAEAWTVAEAESRRHPTDIKLLAAVADYGGRSPEFVKSLLEARLTERQGHPARALHLYLSSLKANPLSDEALKGVTRIANHQLESLN